jgi:hypothetical protein
MHGIQAPRGTLLLQRDLSERPIVDEDRHDGGGFVEEDTAGGGAGAGTPPQTPRSPCEISNDPGVSDAVAPLSTCGVTEYRCGTNEDSTSGPQTQLDFYYDIYTTSSNVSALMAVAYVEERIFMEVAEFLGVDDCRMIFAEQTRRRLLRGLQTILFSGATGIHTAPKDVIRSGTCSSSYNGASESSACIPVEGGFTILGDFPLADTESTYGYVEEIALNDTLVVDSLIEKVIYVGKKEVPTNTGNNPPSPPVEQVVGDEIPSLPRNGNSDGGSITTTTKTLVGVAAGLAAVILLVLLAVRRKRQKQHNEELRQVVVMEEAELDFDVSPDGMSPEGLAIKDSLALVPQDEYPGDTAVETPSNLSRVHANIDVLSEGSDDFAYSGGSSADEYENVLSARLTNSDEDDVYMDTSTTTQDGASTNHTNEINRRTTILSDDAGSMELHIHEDDFVVGAALSRIEESSTQDDDLEFLEAISATSYDTRQSARRTLQMT